MNRSDNPEESFRRVSVPQQPSWIGVERGETSRRHQNDNSDPQFVLEDFVLWSVLSYAVDSHGGDCLNLLLVSKEWKSLVLKLYPPIIMKINHLMQKQQPITQANLTVCWTNVLHDLKQKDCLLYRKGVVKNHWPVLQPQFNVTLMHFCYKVCTQRAPHELSQLLYETTTEYLKQYSRQTVNALWGAVHAHDSPLEKVKNIVDIVHGWKGFLTTVAALTHYLERCYCQKHSLTVIKQVAERALVQAWTDSVEAENTGVLIDLLHQVGRLDLRPSSDADQPVLLLNASDVCETMLEIAPNPLPTPWIPVRDAYSIAQTNFSNILEDARQMREQAAAAEQQVTETSSKPIVIRCQGGSQYRFSHDSHFVKSSGFLKKLHLQPGDVIKVDIPQTSMEKVVEFYAMDEINPCPTPEAPIRANTFQEVLGNVYGEWLDAIPYHLMFEIINSANALELKKLINAACFKVAFMIKSKSPAEIRQIFSI